MVDLNYDCNHPVAKWWDTRSADRKRQISAEVKMTQWFLARKLRMDRQSLRITEANKIIDMAEEDGVYLNLLDNFE